MATGGFDAREDRIRRRELKRLEEEKSLMEQGVEFSDLEEPDLQGPPSQQTRGEQDWVTLDENQNWSLELSESEEEGQKDEDKKEYEEVKRRTSSVQEEQLRIEERMKELDRREQLAVQQEKDLAKRKEDFQKQMKDNEEKVREAIKKNMQREMYADSLKILQKIETDLFQKQKLAMDKEKEIAKREKALQVEEERWKLQQLEMEKTYKEKIKQEIEREIMRKASSLTEYTTTTEKKKHIPIKLEHEGLETTQKEVVLNPGVGCQELGDVRSKVKTFKAKSDKDGTVQSSINKEQVGSQDKEAISKEITDKVEDKKSTKESKKPDEDIPIKPTQEGFYLKPYVGIFSGTEPRPKSESSFEDLKLEVESLIAAKIYPDVSISQAIRKSLRGQAKKVLLNMSPSAKPLEIIRKIENVFGNVASGEAVLQEFYTAEQSSEESVADWGLRLEDILQKAIDKGHVAENSKNEMLRSKFWRSLYSQDLKNATKIYHETIKEFEELRKKVRAEEYEMKTGSSKVQTDVRQKQVKQVAQHQPVIKEQDEQINLLKSLMEKMTVMEKDIQQMKQRPRRRWRSRGGQGGQGPNQRPSNNQGNTETERKEPVKSEIDRKDPKGQQQINKEKKDF